MVEVRAFRSVEYDPTRVELGAVTSPPFDLIDAKTAEGFRARNPFNIVHVTLPKPVVEGAPPAYETIAPRLDQWMAQGVVKTQRNECIYAYEVRWTDAGQERRMRAVLLLLRIDPDYQQVIPHEQIFEKPAEDRVRILKASGWDLEPIEMLYSGKSAEQALWAYVDGKGKSPDLLVTGLDGSHHLLWRVTDPAVIGTVVEGFKGRKAYIADGHHRYAAAVRFAKERREAEYRPPRSARYDYKMVVLVNMVDPGLAIRPTHRIIVRAPRKKPADVLKAAGAWFTSEPDAGPAKERLPTLLGTDGPPTFGIYFGGRKGLHRLVARQPAIPQELAPDHSLGWRSLEVAHLQLLLVRESFGIPEDRWGDDVRYVRDAEEAIRAVDEGKAVAAIFHRPVKPQQVRAVADAGETMPQKSTFFVPKLVSGLVLHQIGLVPAESTRPRPTS